MKPAPKKAAVKKPAANVAPVRRIPMPGDTLAVHVAEFSEKIAEIFPAMMTSMSSLDLSDPASTDAVSSALHRAARYLTMMTQLVATAGVQGSRKMHSNRLWDLHLFLSYSHNDSLRNAYKTETNKAESKKKERVYDDAERLRYATQCGLTLVEYRKQQKAYWVKQKADWDAREAEQLAKKEADEAAATKKLAAVEARRVARQKAKARAAATV